MPVGHHSEAWCDANAPVICVVHDPDTDGLYWANATDQLQSARRKRKVLRTIAVSSSNLLNDVSIVGFAFEMRNYVSRYRDNRAIKTQLGEMAGVEFESSDIVIHFISDGGDMIFWQRSSEGHATHSG